MTPPEISAQSAIQILPEGTRREVSGPVVVVPIRVGEEVPVEGGEEPRLRLGLCF